MPERLEDVFRDCTVRVTGGPMPGAGFFVAPGIVLTCAHVVGAGSGLQVNWERDGRPTEESEARLIKLLAGQGRPFPALEADYPDLAVLGVTGFDGHPCVAIDEALPADRDDFRAFGYPREGGAIRLTPVQLSYRGMNGRLPLAYLDLALDKVKAGMSGAAVLNMRTGSVSGVVVASKDTAHSDGALAVPWLTVAEELGWLLAANRDFHRTNPRWREAYRESRPGVEPESPAVREAGIDSYLSAARAAASQHPYTIHIAGAPALSTVYLRQQLGLQADPAPPPGPDGAASSRRPASNPARFPATSTVAVAEAVRGALQGADIDEPPLSDPNTGVTPDVIREALQRFDIDEVLQRNDGALIVGAAGSGKSSLMRQLIVESADRWLGGTGHTDFIPVLVHARVLLAQLPLHEAIADALRQELGTRLDDVDLKMLLARAPGENLRWLILVDALDEIFEAERRQQVIEIIKGWWGDPKYRFLITSRPLPERELLLLRRSGIPTFEIQDFTDDQLPVLARRWFRALDFPQADEAVELFVNQVRRAGMARLARNPLIATICCVVFANQPDRELPYSRADLYESFITLFLDKVLAQEEFLTSIRSRARAYSLDGPSSVDALVADLRNLLQDIAAARFTDREPSLRGSAERLAARYQPPKVPQRVWQEIVVELLIQSGLIMERSGDLAFTHETIVEFLAACTRVTRLRHGRLGIRERWRLVTQAGSNESYALFVVALMLRDGIDLTSRPPAVLQARKLLHARLVAALVHDGCAVDRAVVSRATQYLIKIATEKTTGIPWGLRRGIWWQDVDCVMAAKALTLIDKDQGLDLLFTLAADPGVPTFSVFDVLAEVMVREDLSEIDSARGLSVLYRIASAPGSADAENVQDSFNRMMIAELILEHDSKLGMELAEILARDRAMDLSDRLRCVLTLFRADQDAAGVLVDNLADADASLNAVLSFYTYLHYLDEEAAVPAMMRIATDRSRSGFYRAITCVALYRDAESEGLHALQELSADQSVPGFHRIYHFAELGDPDRRVDRLSELSRTAALPTEWQIFAAEELWEARPESGIGALRAMRQDPALSRLERMKLSAKVFAYSQATQNSQFIDYLRKPMTLLLEKFNLDTMPIAAARSLNPHEWRVRDCKAHPAMLLPSLGIFLFGLIIATALSGILAPGVAFDAIWLICGLALINLVRSVIGWSTSYFVLTGQRILSVRGLFMTKESIISVNPHVSEMYFSRSVPGRVFGYGTCVIVRPGVPGMLQMKYVPQPELLYRDMLSVVLRNIG